MAELADALDLGSSALKACRFKSCSRHQILFLLFQFRPVGLTAPLAKITGYLILLS